MVSRIVTREVNATPGSSAIGCVTIFPGMRSHIATVVGTVMYSCSRIGSVYNIA